jgi:hypothetical protein
MAGEWLRRVNFFSEERKMSIGFVHPIIAGIPG